MQRPTNRAISLLLALVMILSMLPAIVFAEGEAVSLAGWNVTLSDRIGVNFYLNIDATVADATTVTVDGAAVTPSVDADGYYVVSCDKAAAQMNDDIVLSVTTDGTEVVSGTYSVRKYADSILSGNYDAEVKEMVLAMLHYGAAAQAYFDYNASNLANSGVDSYENAAIPETLENAYYATGTVEGIAFYGASLLFQSKTAVRYYFDVTGDISGYTFKVGETSYEPVAKGEQYYVEVGGINPGSLSDMIVLTVSDGESSIEIGYSPLHYIVRMNAKGSESLKGALLGLYNYHLEALDYAEYLNIIQVGKLQQHSNNTPWVKNENETFIYLNTDAYTATTGEYTSLTADAIKLVRGGEVYSIANPGQGLLVKDSDTQHMLKLTPWGMTGGHLPIQAHDYFIVEGRFVSTGGDGTTIQIAKSYIYYDGTNVEVSDTVPVLPTTVDAGLMQSHSNSHGDYGIYFTMDANAAPYNTDWTLEYTQTSADNIKLIRDDETTSIGIVGRPLIIKYGETDYYLKLEGWNVGDYGMNGQSNPITTDDILVIEGGFEYAAQKVTLNITKSYVYYDGSAWVCSAEAPVKPTTVDVVSLSSHSNGWNSSSEAAGGATFTAAENAAPYATDWSLRYTPVSADVIKLIRDGEETSIANTGAETIIKYSATEYYLEFWPFAQKPMLSGDEIIIEGQFYNAANNTYIDVEKTCFILNADNSITVIKDGYINAGSMSDHANGINGTDGIYATMTANSAPYDGWNIEYAPVSAESYYVIRDGEQINIGKPGRGTLVKYSDTEYYLKLTQWCTDNFAFTTDDIFVIDGFWKQNSGGSTMMKIEKSYLYYNGSAWTFTTEMPTLPTTVEGGVMQSHANGMAATGLYFKLDENAAPYDGWSIEYVQTATSNIKLVRNGATNDIGIIGRPLLIKYSDTEYYLKLEEWTIGSYGLNAADPITTDDVLIIEGSFVYEAENVTLNISKSYVYYDGSAWVCAATLPVEVDGGNMTEHADGWDASGTVFFQLSENALPVDENAELAYTAASGAIKLVRGGEIYELSGYAVKYGTSDYFLQLDDSSYLPLADQDYLIVEGAFANSDNGYTLNVAKTYILVDDDSVVFSTTEPVLESEHEVTGLTNHSNGWTTDGIYITTDAHQATYNSDWTVEYKPVSSDVIKLVRGGVTTSIGQPLSGTLVVYSTTDMYLKTAAWTVIGSVLPFVDGDQIVIEGKFVHEASNTYIVVEKTVICVNGSSLIFNPVFAGNMSNHANGAGGDGVYATMAANSAPYVTDWSTEFAPLTADAYSVIRDGVETNIGIPDRGTLVKYGETDYYLKTSGWCLGDFAATTSDILVIDGFWKSTANDTILKMDTTYLYYDGSAWTFAKELPSVVNGGLMQTHGNGMSGNGIYFTMDANAAPYKTDWTLEYTQTSADNIKIIRDGETLSIGLVNRPLIIKYGETDYYLKLEGWNIGDYGINGQSKAITTDDIIIVEGNFKYAAENVTLNVTKSYVYYDGSAWICSAEAPEQKNIVDVVGLGSHSNGWTSGGFYFTAEANDAPLNTDWSLRYKPVSADVIKLVHDGVTTNKGNTGAETIVKYSATEYYIEGWAVGMSGVVAGDQLIIEGQFYNAANDVYIDIEKTTITFNEGGSATVISESSKYINAGAMTAYAPGPNWFGDGIHFALSSNTAPAAEDWTVRYMPKAASNIKLIRGGETYSIANTGAEAIVKIADGQYWLSLEAWWWSSYAPIQNGDVLIVEGEFANASNGYTLNIDKTYINFVSKDNDDVVFSAVADTEFGEVLLPNSNETMTIGVWNGSHHVFNDARMAELQAAGITKIMGIKPEYTGAEYGGITGMLDRASNYGIDVIVDLRDWDGSTVPDYVNHPALMGFLMYDEPCATDFDALAELKAQFDAVMPEGTLFYVNLYPSCAAGTSLVGTVDWALGRRDYDQYYVQAFLDKLGIEVLSWDNYSLLSGSGIRTDYFYNFEVMAGKDLPLWYTMLSAGHGTTSTSYATPTAAELRWQMAVAMTYGVQNIDHYVYTSHESGYSTMLDYNTETVTDLYYDIKNVNNEYLAWDNIYMAYDWVGVGFVDVGDSNEMLTKLNNELTLSNYGLSASATQDLLIGVFDHEGDKAYMVTNIGSPNSSIVGDGKGYVTGDTTVTLNVGTGYKCVAVIDEGVISYVAVENGSVSINVEAYEGVFVIPVA